MPLPPIAAVAACGSIITAIKSGWELSRMIKRKDLEKHMDKEARSIARDLQDAYIEGLMSERYLEKWYERLLDALALKDGVELRKVRKHIDLVLGARARVTRENNHTNRSTSYDEKHVSRRRPHSQDRRYTPTTEDARYKEGPPRPSLVDTEEAQREYYYAHALPSPYKGEIEYMPLDGETSEHRGEDRRAEHHGHRGPGIGSRTDSYRSQSNGTVGQGQKPPRSVHDENRSHATSSDASKTETYYDRRRDTYHTKPGNGNGSARRI